MRKICFGILCFVICAFSMHAQDIHFSQFYNSPLTINPALTGKEDASYRANLNYRGQWFSLSNARGISTLAASADGRILENSLPRYDKLGIGMQIFHDSAGDGYYNTTTISPSVAYHQSLGYNHRLAVGLQPGYSNTGIDFSNLTFEEQYIGIGFDRSLPSGENLIADNVGYFDLGGGLLYSYRNTNQDWNAYLGGAMYHINQPAINFLDGSEFKRPIRSVLNAGATMNLVNDFVVSPSLLYMAQGGATELTLGSIVGKTLGNPRIVGDTKSVYGGLFWRKGDAIIGKAGLQWNNMQMGFSSDFPISEISNALGFSSAFEMSFTIIGQPDDDTKPIFCPSF